MDKIACIGESDAVHCRMENLMEVAATERKIVISASRCVGKFPLKKMLSDLRAEVSNERWALTFHDNTGNIQIHSSAAAVEDELKEFRAEHPMFAVSVKPKPKTNARKPSGPPGLAPPISTSNTWAAFADEETEVSWPEVGSNGVTPLVMTRKVPFVSFEDSGESSYADWVSKHFEPKDSRRRPNI